MNPGEYQTTISREVSLEGIGLHTGKPSKIFFHPSSAGSGISFCRFDLPEKPIIPASIDQVSEVFRGTTLGSQPRMVHTVEHVLSAIHGLGIDNIRIDLDGVEPPACDGSAKEFVDALLSAGKQNLSAPSKSCSLRESFWLEENERSMAYIPSNQFEISFTIEYSNPLIGNQSLHLVVNEEVFKERICRARTFGFLNEYEMLRSKKLALGGSLENAVVIREDGTLMNPDGIRDKDEFVLHKILDLIGDLSLVGSRIEGHFVAHKTGHDFNVRFAKLLCEKFQREMERNQEKMLDINAIREVIPHRYPFLLVDKILTYELGKSAVGIKNVTANEEFFNGHFPRQPVMPGVLIVEAMAQVAGVLLLSEPAHKGKLPYFVGIDNVRFRKPVVPGDRLEIHVNVLKVRGNTGKVAVEGKVEGKVVASGDLMFTII
ncbi:UDP-3-O-[3-hydroxymyristoyl] N-acetylglucosamine deacetylase [bacterium]|nr:UDP-3-O-[3-hydroxymyristoyl] N-acetylglucosamine deacetylase [bacterium]